MPRREEDPLREIGRQLDELEAMAARLGFPTPWRWGVRARCACARAAAESLAYRLRTERSARERAERGRDRIAEDYRRLSARASAGEMDRRSDDGA